MKVSEGKRVPEGAAAGAARVGRRAGFHLSHRILAKTKQHRKLVRRAHCCGLSARYNHSPFDYCESGRSVMWLY